MKRFTLAIAALGVMSSVAAAQQGTGRSKPQPAERVKVINIDDPDDVIGDRPTHELTPISVGTHAKSSSLIRIRHHFIDLILKAAEGV